MIRWNHLTCLALDTNVLWMSTRVWRWRCIPTCHYVQFWTITRDFTHPYLSSPSEFSSEHHWSSPATVKICITLKTKLSTFHLTLQHGTHTQVYLSLQHWTQEHSAFHCNSDTVKTCTIGPWQLHRTQEHSTIHCNSATVNNMCIWPFTLTINTRKTLSVFCLKLRYYKRKEG